MRDDSLPSAGDDGVQTRGSPAFPQEDDEHQDPQEAGRPVEADQCGARRGNRG